MGLQDEIEPILSKIRAQASVRFRAAIDDPDENRHRDQWAKSEQDFLGTVDDLSARIREFYVLDQHDFETNVHQLTRPSDAKPKLGERGPLVNYPSPFTAFGNIFSADVNYVRPVLELIHTEQWSSPAATAFHDGFLAPFHQAADWQGAYVKELGLAAEMLRSTTEAAKKGITFVARGTLAALNYHQLYETVDTDWRGELGALSIFLAAVGLFLPAGGAALVVGSMSLASGIASLEPADKKPYLQVDDGPYPEGIIRNAEYAVKDLREMVFDLDDIISAGLDRDLNSSDRFASPNLKVGSATVTPDAYGHLDIKDADGKPPDQVVVSIVQLARAGYYNLPGAAYEYNAALSCLDACTVPGSMTTMFPRSIGKFNAATAQLAGIVQDTRDRLNNAGDAMVAAARAYRGTDEENAAIIQGITDIPPHHSNAPFH